MFDLKSTNPQGKFAGIIPLTSDVDKKNIESVEKWVDNTKKHGGVLVLHMAESNFKILDLCDIAYKFQILSSGNFTKISLMKFREYIV